MNILVTGGAGYLGSVLVPKLLSRGHQVRVVDLGYFGLAHLRGLTPAVQLIRDDLRAVVSKPAELQELLAGVDCIIHLAAISNDPSAELNPELTEEVNYCVTQRLAEAAKQSGIKFIFSSSCSIYGDGVGELDENSSLNPLTVYAASKIKAERGLAGLARSDWEPIILRNGTLFGYSPRMRFDLVVNIFSLYSSIRNQITIFGDGLHWRPFLHVTDCARAFVHFAEKVETEESCYNIAHENLRVIDVAKVFERINPELSVTHFHVEDEDRRDYRVSVKRMHEAGFLTRTSVEVGAEEMTEAIVGGLIRDPESIFYRNAKWLKELSQIGSKNHFELVTLMETLAEATAQRRV